jgi:hypothetical protein
MAKKLALINPAMHSDLYSSNLLYSPLALAYVAAYTPNDGKSPLTTSTSTSTSIPIKSTPTWWPCLP